MNYIIKFLKILLCRKMVLWRVGGITLKVKFPDTKAAFESIKEYSSTEKR